MDGMDMEGMEGMEGMDPEANAAQMVGEMEGEMGGEPIEEADAARPEGQLIPEAVKQDFSNDERKWPIICSVSHSESSFRSISGVLESPLAHLKGVFWP